MSRQLEELPLFPLSTTVLFPFAQVQLHVFEDRYREMVRECLEFEKPFGIVLIRSGPEVGGHADPYLVGTTVRILKVMQYDDGRMDIQVKGERRFRIRKLDDSRDYLVGYVEPVIELEVEDSPRADALLMRAREDFQLWMKKLFERQDFSVQVKFPDDMVALSFTIANLLPIENIEKQRLLETTDTLERLSGLIPLLEQQLVAAAPPTLIRQGPDDLNDWLFKN